MDRRIYIGQKNLLHVFWFLRQCKTPGSFGSDFRCLQLHWSTRVAAGREGIRRLIFQIQGHNFRTVRKRLYSHRIHVVRQVTPHMKVGKWLTDVLWCELRILVKSFVERVYNCYFHFCPLFRSLPGALADYWWADSELDRGTKPHGWKIFWGVLLTAVGSRHRQRGTLLELEIMIVKSHSFK